MVNRAIILALCLAACGSDSEPQEMLAPDAALAPSSDAAPSSDFGTISGACDLLDDELVSATPELFRVAIEFDRLYTSADSALLSSGAQLILEEGTAGGSSVLSEVFAYEVLRRCESADLLKTETTIEYDEVGSLTDFLALMDQNKIGVSVTRAVAFPFDAAYSDVAATDLLTKKLGDILESSANVSAVDRWEKQILAILAYGPAHADTIEQVYQGLEAALKADTLVYLIVTDGSDDFLYCDGACE